MSIRYKTLRDLHAEPVTVKTDVSGAYNALRGADGKLYPASFGDGVVTAILTVPAGEYEFEPDTLPSNENDVKIGYTGAGDRFDITVGGSVFASYVYDEKLAKPYLGPIMTPFGESYTRLDFETKEHPHHRSVFFGVGDVTVAGAGKHVDFWNEPENCGIQRHGGIENVVETAAYASFDVKTMWCAHDGAPMTDAVATYKFYAQPEGCRYIDVSITYTASYGDVIFGKTKEAGPLGVRMADPLRAERGGYIANSYGGRGEAECWGRAANWCVYGGKLSGHDVGVAIFDDPKNERYPTTWHIRDYGLFAANNLYFRGGLTIPAGTSLTYAYRIVFFASTADDAHIADRFIAYCK